MKGNGRGYSTHSPCNDTWRVESEVGRGEVTGGSGDVAGGTGADRDLVIGASPRRGEN